MRSQHAFRGQEKTWALHELESRVFLTGAAPIITSPVIFGVHPGTPLLFDVTASGDRPMTFGASGLPAGVAIDPQTGMITGSLGSDATYDLTVNATNPAGTATQKLRIVVGDKIELTPAMGWNSWTVYVGNISDAKIREQAQAMATSGLINYGWNHINIDAGWEGGRTAVGAPIQGNAQFPDMAGLSAYIHSLDLKFGLYTTPMPYGYLGEAAGSTGLNIWPDAQQFANWGVDYLKYDGDPPSQQDIEQMSQALKASGRDIALSISLAGGLKSNAAAFYQKWAEYRRVGADITDFSVNMIEDGISLMQPWVNYSAPGSWNDADNLELGVVGNGGSLHPSQLTFDQQKTQMSIWVMDAAPLLLGNDLTQLDASTLSLLTNNEVLAIDQDPLGIQSHALGNNVLIQSRPLADGSTAVELINLGDGPANISFNFADVGLNGPQIVRDIWQKQDIGTFNGSYTGQVPAGGTALLELRAATAGAPQISAQPINRTTNLGQTATYSIAATGAGTLSYQWSENGVAIAGANAATFTTAATTANDDGATIRCTVSNNVGSILSYGVELNVRGLTSFLSDSRYFSGTTGYYSIEMDQSATQGILTIGGTQYAKGIGTHSPSEIDFLLDGKGGTFQADVGIDDNQPGFAKFQVWLDGTMAYDSGVLTGGMAPLPVSVDVRGAHVLQLIVANGADNNNYARSDWANARITTALIPVALPTLSDINESVSFNTPLAFAAADFTTAFHPSGPGESLQTVKITALPTHGTLKLSGTPVTLSQTLTVAQLPALSYTPATDYNGSDTFTWNGSDHAGYADVPPASVLLTILPPEPTSTAPQAPLLTVASTASATAINIAWTDASAIPNIADSYFILASTDNSTFTQVGIAAAGATAFPVTGLTASTKFYFKVIGHNVVGNSVDSNILSATTLSNVVQPPAVKVLFGDDRGPTWFQQGNWGNTVEPGRYFGDGHSFAIGGHGADIATWTFTNLTPGNYRISATWRADTNRATNAPFTILDGATIVGSVTVNQQLQPASLLDNNTNWGDLGALYAITGTTLTIRLTDNADLYVDADAVRIEWVSALASNTTTTTPPGGTTTTTPPANTTPPDIKVVYGNDFGSHWSYTGNWGQTVEEGRYFDNDHAFAIGGQGADTGTWTFINLTPGRYRISATWRGDNNRATNAPFTIFDGSTSLGTVLINQQNSPNSLIDDGFSWGDLGGPYNISSGTLAIRLTDNADLYVDADAVRIEWLGAISSTPLPPTVLYADDRGPNWSSVGTWGNTVEPGRYYGDGHSFAIGGAGADVASWTFNNLAPGTYRISTTWRGDTNRATNAPYAIFDGSNKLATVIVNQQLMPAGFSDAGVTWFDLQSSISITSGKLVVTLADDADLYVDADAIRIERIGD